MERELATRKDKDSTLIFCKACCWNKIVIVTTSKNVDGEIRRVFEKHDCTRYPKCHVEGCTRIAEWGYREFMNGNTSETQGPFLGNSGNYCGPHDKEMKLNFGGPNVRRVDLTSLQSR